MHHITLTTGDIRWSPREEVDDELMRLLVDHLHAALQDPAPVPGHQSLYAHATAHHNVLMLTVSQQQRDATIPLVTLAAVPDGVDVAAIAALMHAPQPLAPNVLARGPWCLVTIYPTIALAPRETISLLGDYERCIAWAWIESGAASGEVQ